MALPVLVAVGLIGLIVCLWVAIFAAAYHKASPDEALVITKPSRERAVSFASAVAIPVVHKLDRVSLREHAVGIDRHGDGALRTRDDRAVELVATFRLRVERTQEDVLRALAAMGDRTSDGAAVRERFEPVLTQALEEVARRCDAETIDRDRARFRDDVASAVETVLRDHPAGFVLEGVAITGVRVQPGSAYRG